MQPAVLDLSDISYSYPRTPRPALEGISLRVAPGEMVALVGESGSGKSTLARVALGLVAPDAGQVMLAGQHLAHLSPAQAKGLRAAAQMVFQDPFGALDPRFDVTRTLEQPLRIHRRLPCDRAARQALVAAALDRVGLTPPEVFAGRATGQLSGGQRQRLGIAAALMTGPRLLIADEPVSMLDVSVRAGVMQLFAGLVADGIGMLLITHDLATAVHHAYRMVVLYRGRVVEEGPSRALIDAPAHPYTRALVAATPRRLGTRPAVPLVEAASLDVPVGPGCAFRTRCPEAGPACAAPVPRHTVSPGRSVACHHPPEGCSA